MPLIRMLHKPEDRQWLRETHLRGHGLPAFKCAIVVGNEDCPERIELFADDRDGCKPAEAGVYYQTQMGDRK